jgi:hypothetical protein
MDFYLRPELVPCMEIYELKVKGLCFSGYPDPQASRLIFFFEWAKLFKREMKTIFPDPPHICAKFHEPDTVKNKSYRNYHVH